MEEAAGGEAALWAEAAARRAARPSDGADGGLAAVLRGRGAKRPLRGGGWKLPLRLGVGHVQDGSVTLALCNLGWM